MTDGSRTTRTQVINDGTETESPPAQVVLDNDAFGRLTTVTEARPGMLGGDAVWAYGYDANDNMESIIDADGNRTSMVHDFVGQRRTISRSPPAGVPGPTRTWSYTYDLNGNMESEMTPHESVLDDARYTSTWAYDALDRVTSHVSAERDLANVPGALSRYFPLGRMTVYTYDESGHGSGRGRLTHVDLPFGRIDYDYTVEGRVSREARQFEVAPAGINLADTGREYRVTYNALGSPTTVTHADSGMGTGSPTVTRASYDERGLPATLELLTVPPVQLAELHRNRAGLPMLRTSAYAQGQTWVYDVLGRVKSHNIRTCPLGQVPFATSKECAMGLHANAQSRHGETLTYWGTGNLATFRQIYTNSTLRFTYDPQQQLETAETIAGGNLLLYSAGFAYTPGGRMDTAYVGSTNTSSKVRPREVAYDYSPTAADPAAVTSLTALNAGDPTSGTFSYDASGNLLHREYTDPLRTETHDFTYDGNDHVREVILPDGSGEIYYYDHTGQRMLAYHEPSGSAAPYLRQWFGATEIKYAATTSTTPKRTDVHATLGAMPVARINRTLDGGITTTTVDLLYSGTLGSLLAVLSPADGTVRARFAYGPFGEILQDAGTVEDDFHRLYEGKEHDELTSLSYFGFRYYDRLTLTWTQADPLYRFVPDLAWDEPRRGNLYSFVMNNPLRYLDPDGRDPSPSQRKDPEYMKGFCAGQPSSQYCQPNDPGKKREGRTADEEQVEDESAGSGLGEGNGVGRGNFGGGIGDEPAGGKVGGTGKDTSTLKIGKKSGLFMVDPENGAAFAGFMILWDAATGLAGLVRKGVTKIGRVITGRGSSGATVTFGRNANQIHHAFRHTDALGLARGDVTQAIQRHVQTVASRVPSSGRPLNQVIEVSGQRIQYSAYRLSDGTINVGRIHGVP